jgi:hypothetical protein
MKKIITALVFLLAAVSMSAQYNVQRKATGYIKDGNVYYQVTGCVPFSDLEFYSEPSGGNLLAVVQADNLGEAVIKIPAGVSYAFALNRVKATKKGDAGIALYIALGVPVMEVKSVKDEAGILQWQVITSREGVTSEVYSSSDGMPYSQIATLRQADAVGNNYQYTTAGSDGGKTVYCVQVTEPATGLKVMLGKNAVSKESVPVVRVSPSVFTDVINVQVQQNVTGYVQVFNNVGNLVYNGNIRQGNNSINLSKFAAASYIIKVTGRNNRTLYNGRVVKSL